MTPAITLEELLAWNHEAAAFWNTYLQDNPDALELQCGIGGAITVQDLVSHIWAVELRWGQRIAGHPETPREDLPNGPLYALYGLHEQAFRIFQTLLNDPTQNWDATRTMAYDWLPPHARTPSLRKLAAHALFHSQRHWAQLATLVRAAGFPSAFQGDLLFSSGLS